MNLEILKTYIEPNLVNGFIMSFNSLVSASIFFVKKSNRSFWLYIDYKDFNKLTIKNCTSCSWLVSL